MLKIRMLNCYLFFFNDTATTEIYTLSLHDALPISPIVKTVATENRGLEELAAAVESYRDFQRTSEGAGGRRGAVARWRIDRKSTRLNSSHANISYAVFCLKKKKKIQYPF